MSHNHVDRFTIAPSDYCGIPIIFETTGIRIGLYLPLCFRPYGFSSFGWGSTGFGYQSLVVASPNIYGGNYY
jgi:hypothetical protein